MNDDVRLVIVDPPDPIPGVIGVAVPETRLSELNAVEQSRKRQLWRVRGVISAHIPLAGDIHGIINSERTHNFFLNSPSLTIYLHRGGHDAIFFDLVALPSGRLDYIEYELTPIYLATHSSSPGNRSMSCLMRWFALLPIRHFSCRG